MENQELFDKYIHGELSPGEKVNFESKLKADKEFAKEFKTFLLVVQGIQKEEQQDCADFGAAMKKLSKEELQEIIGAKANPRQKKVLKFSPWLWSSMSAAAVVAIVITISFNLINQSRLDVNNAQYMAYNLVLYRQSPIHPQANTLLRFRGLHRHAFLLFLKCVLANCLTFQKILAWQSRLHLVFLRHQHSRCEFLRHNRFAL